MPEQADASLLSKHTNSLVVHAGKSFKKSIFTGGHRHIHHQFVCMFSEQSYGYVNFWTGPFGKGYKDVSKYMQIF